MTNLPGADLNAACSGPNGARLMDEPSNERCQRTCNLKYDEYTRGDGSRIPHFDVHIPSPPASSIPYVSCFFLIRIRQYRQLKSMFSLVMPIS
ncbi:hypothetical protein EO763_00530 [Pectobacterium odoriferum]|nr:hypothetical protein EO763_00530 [Pectobacterium odoriferum]